MNKFYVFYNDGEYPDDSCIGLDFFFDKQAAIDFINERIKQNPEYRKIEMYTLIKGNELQLKVVEIITKITAE